MNDDQESESLTFDARTRRLCPDGACVGLMGPDGRCALCGAEDTKNPVPGLGAEAFRGGCTTDEPAEAKGVKQDVARGDDAFDAGRKLCSDGSCLGVIGAQGVCGICGRGGAD